MHPRMYLQNGTSKGGILCYQLYHIIVLYFSVISAFHYQNELQYCGEHYEEPIRPWTTKCPPILKID